MIRTASAILVKNVEDTKIENIFTKLANFVSQSAPLLGSVLGSPLAGVAVSLISNALGNKTSNPEDLLSLLSADPDALSKLKSIENKHQETLLQIQVQAFSQEVSDRDSARKMQIENKSYVPHILAFLFTIIYAAIQYHVIQHTGGDDDIISARVQDIMILIMSFYFGGAFKKN